MNVVRLETVAQFRECMILVRNVRRKMVRSLLEGVPVDSDAINILAEAESALNGDAQDFKRSFRLANSADSLVVHFNIKDELTGIRQDLKMTQSLAEGCDGEAQLKILAKYHPSCEKDFGLEVGALLEMMDAIPGGIEVLITDWDGTLKTYSSTYVTCMQPAYSAVLISRFAAKFTRFAAVLTAGPLRDSGILDLTAIPEDGHITFGGSWGREWQLDGRRIVDDSCFTPDRCHALDSLTEAIGELLQEDRFRHFRFVGSGFQRKVDRLSLGIQNVSEDISADITAKYVSAVLDCVGTVDPEHQLFVLHQSPLDLEVILKSSGASDTWNKANGIQFVLQKTGIDIKDGSVLICGDTESDLPMVRFALDKNPQSFAVFVAPSSKLRQELSRLFSSRPSHLCCVSCPEVVHAAMAKMLTRPENISSA